jgi:NitT/TauT family transport system ATP-binding protein
MQQRCNLARALTVDPQILIMDEPFAALDAQTREIMQAELLRIWNEARKTILFITHQINEAIYLADRVIVFGARPGKVKEMIKIDLPRPRNLSIKRDPKFLEYEDKLWNLIEEEVKKTMVQDQVVHNINN